MSIRDLERRLFAQPTPVTALDGVVTAVTPAVLVRCTGDDEPGEVVPLIVMPAVDQRVLVLTIDRRRYCLPFAQGGA